MPSKRPERRTCISQIRMQNALMREKNGNMSAAIAKMLEQRVVPLYGDTDEQCVRQVVEALVNGGSGTFEFVNRSGSYTSDTDFEAALEVFNAVRPWARSRFPQLHVGAGTI